MKLRRVSVENLRSFLSNAELQLAGDISIIIGPNGGGKTNLLDIISATLRRHLLTSWLPVRSGTPQVPDRYEFRANDVFQQNPLEKHSRAPGATSRIELDLEVTAPDLVNMAAMRDNAAELSEFTGVKFLNVSYSSASKWDLSLLEAGQVFTYVIVDDSLQAPQGPAAQIFREYLGLFDADTYVRNLLGKATLSMPMVSMPVNRASAGFQASLSLAGHNDVDYKRQVDAASSRNPAAIVTLAIGRLASRYRLLLEKDTGRARAEFYAEPRIASLSRILGSLGYTWELQCTDPLSNQYTVMLTKQGTSFLVGAASSGEKELLTYLFAIYALNVRDALIVVDEPELHLHPRWQRILLRTFEELAAETGNQFLLATHSPVFVSPSSIGYVSRVHSKGQESQITRLDSAELPNRKHLLNIVNSQNNERLFFADKVVLVEGISDRLVFDYAFAKCGVYAGTARTCEIIEVGGKGFFTAYQKLLEAAEVPYVTIADLDYVNEVAPGPIKALFEVNEKKIDEDVIRNPGSKDGLKLAARIGDALEVGDMRDLRDLWGYIQARCRTLKRDLNGEERAQLESFLAELRKEGTFVLSRGSLEDYLPQGYRSKDLEKLLQLLEGDLWAQMPREHREELETIAAYVKEL